MRERWFWIAAIAIGGVGGWFGLPQWTILVAFGATALALLVSYLGVPWLREWRRRKRDPVDEWIVSLDGRDLGVVAGREFVDMFWFRFQIVPTDDQAIRVLTDQALWDKCRFSFRHRISGRVAPHVFNGANPACTPKPEDMHVVLRGLY